MQMVRGDVPALGVYIMVCPCFVFSMTICVNDGYRSIGEDAQFRDMR